MSVTAALAAPDEAPHLTAEAPALHGWGGASSEGVVAARNALTLGATMFAGMATSLIVRLAAVRLLGPEAFGQLRFAESAAEMVFVGLTLGVDTLLRREAAVDPARARGYLHALVYLRVAAGAALLTLISLGLTLAGQGGRMVALFLVLGTAQILIVLNNSYSAMEHASGRVGWISRVTLRFKLLWAGLAVVVLAVLPSALALAAVLLLVEALRLLRLGARHGSGRVSGARADLGAAGAAAVASMPFFIHYLAHNLYARLGVWWLGGTAPSSEVGWYGAASTMASVAMLGMPLISWVLVPATAREGLRSGDGAARLFDGALRMALLVATPISVVVGLGATLWVRVLFGEAYLDAAGALRVLAPTFTLAYIATVSSVSLVQQGRVGAMAAVSVAGLALSLVLNAVLIPWGAEALGVGGAATGAAGATLLTEVAVTAALLRSSRSGPWSAALLRTAAALGASTGAAFAVGMIPLAPWVATAGAAAAFLVVLLSSGAITATDIRFFRSVLRRTKHEASAPL